MDWWLPKTWYAGTIWRFCLSDLCFMHSWFVAIIVWGLYYDVRCVGLIPATLSWWFLLQMVHIILTCLLLLLCAWCEMMVICCCWNFMSYTYAAVTYWSLCCSIDVMITWYCLCHISWWSITTTRWWIYHMHLDGCMHDQIYIVVHSSFLG